MMIEERVKEMLKRKQWTMEDLTNLKGIVISFREELYNEMTAKEKLDLVWNVPVDPMNNPTMTNLEGELLNDEPFGAIIVNILESCLEEEIVIVIKKELMSANVNFNKEEDKNEVPKRSVGRKPSKKRPTNEKTNSKE